MSKKMHTLFMIFFTIILIMGLTATADAKTAEEYIYDGETAFFSKTVDGILEAHSIFQDAQAAYPIDPVINAYLALTRLLDLALTEDAGGLTDLLAQYGVSRIGNELDTLEFEPYTYTEHYSSWEDKNLMIPKTAPSGETIRSFLAGPLLTAINDSIVNLDITIANWSSSDKHIIDASLIDSEMDIEFDYGDVLLLRAALKAAKSLVLIVSAYDLDVSVRELVAFGNLDYDLFFPNEFLDRYPNFLNLLTTSSTPSVDGTAQLLDARTALLGAVDDYLAASDAIRNDPGTADGAEELIALEDCDLLHEEFIWNQLVKIKNNLTDPKPVIEFADRDETWTFVEGMSPLMEVHFYNDMSEGEFQGIGGPFAGSSGWIDCIIISDYEITIEMGGATFTGTINPERTVITGGNYTGWTEGTFTAGQTDVEEKITRIDLNPFFGTGTSPNIGPYNVRDLLPQFNECGNPIAGTAGHGLLDDPTLGGILPDFTQDDWELEGTLCGTVDIPIVDSGAITIDGDITDWTGISPVFTGVAGNNDPNFYGTDINGLYLAKDDSYLYLAMTLHDGAPNTEVKYAFVAANQGCGYNSSGELQTLAYYDGESSSWVSEVIHSGDWELIGSYPGYAYPGSDTIEWQVPLSDMGNLSGRYVRVYTQENGNEPSEDHATCLQILPITSITGTLNVPAHNGEGAIYIGVFQYNVDYEANPDYFITGDIIYPGGYSAGMTYTVPDVPENEKVFVGAWWDADLNGVQTTGDYVGNTDMVTTGSTPTTVDLVADELYLLDTDSDQMDDIWEIDYFGDLSHDGYADGDSDLLTDLQEYNNKTNPNNADSDGDGLKDGEEINPYATGPTNPDSDGDGYSDGEEVAWSPAKDPNNPGDKPQYGPGVYYAAPDNSLWGDGTETNPWNLHTAIHHINQGLAGSYTLYAGAGTYQVTEETEPDEELVITQNDVAVIGETGDISILDGNEATNWIIGLEIAASNVTINNIAVKGFADWGIRISSASGAVVEGCEIYDNGFEKDGGGIHIENCSPDIRKNKIHNNYPVGILVEGDGAGASPYIERNEIYNNNLGISVNGIGSGGIAAPSITNNLIYGTSSTTAYGIQVSGASGTASPFIYHNTINSGASYGIYIINMGGTTTPNIQYNIITNFEGYGIYNSAGNPTIDYNDVWNNTGDYYGCPGGDNDISQDPGYAGSGNYLLPPASPCIDAILLTAEDPVTDDLEGNTRPRWWGFDMGAYEYQEVDYDSDSIDDHWEIIYFGDITSHSGTADSDSDGLTDLQEYQNTTNPNNSDSDGDGLKDGEEVNIYSTDPNNSDSDGDGYYDGEEVRKVSDPNDIEIVPQYEEGNYYVDIFSGNDLTGDGSSGNPWKTMSHTMYRVDNGPAGSYYIYVASGTYSVDNGESDDTHIITKNDLAIIGEAGSMPVLDGAGAIQCTIGIEIAASNVIIKNIAVTGFAHWGIMISGTGNIIERCAIFDNGGGIEISGSGAENNLIRNNDIYSTVEPSYPQATGIAIDNAGLGNKIYKNKIHGHTGSGGYCGIYVVDSSPDIMQNEIYDNYPHGISVWNYGGEASPNIWNNLIYGTTETTEYGIYLYSEIPMTLSPTIYHNTVDGGLVDGIFIQVYGGTADPDIKYNIITNFAGYGINNSDGEPTIDYNNVWHNGPSEPYDQNYSGCEGWVGANDICLDPTYFGGGDYHLQPGSLCINTIPTADPPGDTVEIDFADYARPKGSGYDMGAYEFIADIAHNFELPGGTGDPTDYRMFTVPVELHTGVSLKQAMEEALGDYDKGIWRVFAWDPVSSSYIELDDEAFANLLVYPGRGFWVISTLTDTITFSGKPAPDGGYLDIPLSPGWNMVAIPWSVTSIGLDKIAVSDGRTNYWITSTSNIFTQQWVWDYTGTGANNGYDKLAIGAVLQPGKAYWIKVLGTAEITMLVPKDEEGGYFSASSVKTALKASAMVEDTELPPPPPGVSGGGTTASGSGGCFIGTVAPME